MPGSWSAQSEREPKIFLRGYDPGPWPAGAPVDRYSLQDNTRPIVSCGEHSLLYKVRLQSEPTTHTRPRDFLEQSKLIKSS